MKLIDFLLLRDTSNNLLQQLKCLRTHVVRRYIMEPRHRRLAPFVRQKNYQTAPITVYYRISDAGYAKNKPAYINNENCLRNAVIQFPLSEYKWVLVADNCSVGTMDMIRKYVPQSNIMQVSVGNGAGTFRLTFDMALKQPDNEAAYFVENDYLHRQGSSMVLRQGLELAHYVTLYDHPDKYDSNCFLTKRGGELSRVRLSDTCHWKTQAATTMTFGARINVLKRDKDIFCRWTSTRFPFDCEMWLDLKRKGRELISPIPSYATHGETAWLAPFVDWEQEERASRTE